MQSKFNFQKFKEEVILATKKAFLEIMDEYEDSTVNAFSLTCDSAVSSIGVVANTKEALEEKIEDEEDRYYYKFCEQEWEIWNGADNEFKEIGNDLVEFQKNNKNKMSDAETCIYTDFFNEFRENIFDICVQALMEIKDENFFEDNCKESIIINFMVSEYLDEDYSIEVFSKLNNGIVVEEYKQNIESFM
ncbi:DUF4303 domain-containing protein [Clostridium gasigenes]|uniref:DUF4303 domain-containing protein n=1 Tax=Clostridium gasigenes TaxID=94869 RepID=UPI001C0BA6AC|nr:DUF4303 domain-containing protein [Clostridium gasigenes]MBU3104295.1 DUF4303 domain-containing protein [Clostridium gasigenes]